MLIRAMFKKVCLTSNKESINCHKHQVQKKIRCYLIFDDNEHCQKVIHRRHDKKV